MSPSCFSTAIMPSPYQQQSIAARSKFHNGDSQVVPITDSEAVDLSQVYVLIDSILPFEACLYYQVLPLFFEGSRLTIGTVNPDDPEATEYVKKQLSYINYTISLKEISSDCHRNLLSKYLNHTAKKRQQTKESTLAQEKSTNHRPQSPIPNPQNFQQTFIVDQPTEIHEIRQLDQDLVAQRDRPLEEALSVSKTPPAIAPPLQPDHSEASAANGSASNAVAASEAVIDSAAFEADFEPLCLRLDARYQEVPNSDLLSLQPQGLMQALLSKVLAEGIGRLYLERRPQGGRILWSRDGVLQSIVEAIDGQIFQGVINELKRLTHLSLIPVKKSKQVEIERTYEGQRILLRFRVMPSDDGEEATLQVLRGTALRFYQQQQIDRLGRDALDAAQVLQTRLSEIRDRARSSLNPQNTRSETLPALVQLLKQMENQVEEILTAYDLSEVEAALASEADLKDRKANL